MTNNTAKKAFVAPVLTKYGKFEELTQGGSSGDNLDADFSNDTPFSDLTFS